MPGDTKSKYEPSNRLKKRLVAEVPIVPDHEVGEQLSDVAYCKVLQIGRAVFADV
jgi:hypothetical protein